MAMITLSRRHLLVAAGAVTGLAACGPRTVEAADNFLPDGNGPKAYVDDPFRKISEDQWAARLHDDLAYGVLRQQDTEDTFSSPLLDEHRKGVFHCKGCDLALFESKWKYDSHTGWPSFWDVMREHVGTQIDHFVPTETRIEYHCARCLGHQGHIFHDGPKPTGLRYCNNGAALIFKPGEA